MLCKFDTDFCLTVVFEEIKAGLLYPAFVGPEGIEPSTP